MEKIKEKIMKALTGFAKRHRELVLPVIALLAVLLTGYHLFREIWRKLCQSKFRRRMICFLMVGLLLFTQTDVLSVLAIEEDDTQIHTVTGFEELPDEVREQTVPVGTTLEELNPPGELTAYVKSTDGGEMQTGGAASVSGSDITGAASTQALQNDGAETGGQTVSGSEMVSSSDVMPGTDQVESEEVSLSVIWQPQPEYDGNTVGEYIFRPVLPEGYLPEESVNLPEIKVTVTNRPEIAVWEPDEEQQAQGISVIFTVSGQWDSYDWQVWYGEEYGGWISLEETGAELPVTKDMFTTYAFRCVVTLDDRSYESQSYAYNEAALVQPVYNIQPLLDFSSAEEQSSNVAWAHAKNSFDIYGVNGDGSFYKTTYANYGYRIGSQVDGVKKNWNAESGEEVAMGSSLTGKYEVDLVYGQPGQERYVQITYTVINSGSTEQSFQIGSSADVMIDRNDKAPVVGSSMGLKMEDGQGKTFNLVVPTADTVWYGFFSQAYTNIFTDLEDKSTVYSGDSGMAWSWSGTLQPGQTWTRTALIGVGELPDPAKTPSLTDSAPQFTVGQTDTITGTAGAGDTVYITVNGQEFSGTVDEDGTFAVDVTLSGDTPPDEEAQVQVWAVTEEGGISEIVTVQGTIFASPSIVLTDTAITITEEDVIKESWYTSFIRSSVGKVTHTSISTDTPGVYSVTYRAQVEGMTETAEAVLTVTVQAKPLSISTPAAVRSGSTSSFALEATLHYPGPDTISETGFVWGIMQNPTTDMNNGRAATSGIVRTKGGKLSVTAGDIVDGTTYYCRAYVIAGGNTYYSSQHSFGYGANQYGTFSVSGSGSTFTISRSDGTNGTQTVYYRTMNGSAVAGTHYTAAAGSVTFAEGETTKTVTVQEAGANAVYSNKLTTAYANGNREYFFEIYRVDGGGKLGDDIRVTRTLTTNKTFEKSNYDFQTIAGPQGDKTRGDCKDDQLGWTNGQAYDAAKETINVQSAFLSGFKDYWINTAQGLDFYLTFEAWEGEAGYQALQITPGESLDTYIYPDSGQLKGTANTTYYITLFEHRGSGKSGTHSTYQVPFTGTGKNTGASDSSTNVNNSTYYHNSESPNGDYVRFNVNEQYISVGYGACGDNSDIWHTSNVNYYLKLVDTQEPQLLGVGSMESVSTYKEGDTFYISLIFDEIVDAEYSTLENVSVATSWGAATYAGGADTNVLYFRGTVPANASGSLTLNSITGTSYIKDMCNDPGTGTDTASGSGTAGGAVNNTTPAVSISNAKNENGTLSAKLTATNSDELKYTWTQSASLPVTGWFTAASGDTVTTRQTGGTWYLHVLAANNGSGKTAHTYQSFTISSGGGTVTLPSLEVSADNTSWDNSRTIKVTKSPADASVTYSGPGVSSRAVNGNSVTVTQNGVYTFTLQSGQDKVVQQVTVSRIDRENPTAVITEPGGDFLNQSDNVTFTITPGDTGGAGVASVTGTWSDTGSSAANVLTANGDGTYTAVTTQASNTSGTWELNVTVTDHAGNSRTVSSQTYTVNRETPAVTVTQGSTAANGSVNYTYTVNANGQTIQSIELPDGTITTDLSGSFQLTSAGTYYVIVTDTAGHVVNSSPMVVTDNPDNPVDGEAPQVRLNQDTVEWVNTAAGVTIYVSVYDNVEPVSASWSGNGTNDQSITLSRDADAGVGDQAKTGSFQVTANGVYTVTAKDKRGNSGTATIEITNFDTTVPTVSTSGNISGWQSTDQTISFTWSDGESGGVTGKYVVDTSAEAPVSESSYTNEIVNRQVTVSAEGTHYLHYRVTDAVGNVTTGTAGPIRIDKTTPTLQVTGGTIGAAALSLNIVASYGSSGGTVKVGKDGGAAQPVTGDSYTIDSKGSYTFTATSGAGLEKEINLTVCGIAFDANGGNPVSGKLVVSGGVYGELPQPTRTGYTFDGWYTAASGGDRKTAADTLTADTALYAHWTPDVYQITYVLDGGTNAANAPSTHTYGTVTALQGAVKAGYTFAGWYDAASGGEKLTELAADGYTTGITLYAGWVDDIAPVFGEVSYNEGYKNFLDWIIRKESLILTIPLTEQGSGVGPEGVTYTLTPKGGTESQAKTAPVTGNQTDGYEATVTIDTDFKGQVKVTATDESGQSAARAIGADGKGVIVEDSAPVISFSVDGGDISTSYYDTAPTVKITVTDSQDNAISGGLQWVTYQVGTNAEQTVTYDGRSDFTYTAEIMIDSLPTGVTEITVSAVDNAGNTAVPASAVIRVKGPEKQPEAQIDYQREALTGLVPGGDYVITFVVGDESRPTAVTADGDGQINIESAWFGQTISIVQKGDGVQTKDSPAQDLAIPVKEAAAPGGTGAVYVSAENTADGKITGVAPTMEYSADGGKTWHPVEGAVIENLLPGSYEIRYQGDQDAAAFPSLSVTVTVGVKSKEKTPSAVIDYEKEALTGLEPGAVYLLDGIEYTAESDGSISIPARSFGSTLQLKKQGNGIDTLDSHAQSIAIPDKTAEELTGIISVYVSASGASDGKLTGVTEDMEYSSDGGKTWQAVTGTEITGLPKGSYQVRIAGSNEGKRFKSESVTIIVGIMQKEPAPGGIRIDYENGALTGLEPGESYLIDGEEFVAGADGKIPIPESMLDGEEHEVQKKGNGSTTADSNVENVLIPKKPEKPSGITVAQEDDGQGMIVGVTEDMEYSADGGKTWQPVTGNTIENLPPGSYEIRYQGDNDANRVPSDSVTVIIPETSGEGDSSEDSGSGGGDSGDSGSSDGGNENGGGNTEGNGADGSDNATSGSSADSDRSGSSGTSGNAQNSGSINSGNASDANNSGIGNTGSGSSANNSAQQNSNGDKTPAASANGDQLQRIDTILSEGSLIAAVPGTESGESQKSGAVATGNVQKDSLPATVLSLGEGAVIVTVVCEDEHYTTGVTDTVAVANAVLTTDQIQQVNGGENIEIRVDVKDISGKTEETEKQVVESGLTEYRESIPQLEIGMYIDISLFVRSGDGDWNTVSQTKEPIEVVIGVPRELQGSDRRFYVIRSHAGEAALLYDLDEEPDTITIQTELFSTYAIAYEYMDGQAESSDRCGLCHMCTPFLGVCCFVWIAVILLVILLTIWRIHEIRKEKQENQE